MFKECVFIHIFSLYYYFILLLPKLYEHFTHLSYFRPQIHVTQMANSYRKLCSKMAFSPSTDGDMPLVLYYMQTL